MYNPEAAKAFKREAYETYFQPHAKLAGEMLLNPIVGEVIDLRFRSTYAQVLESEADSNLAGAAGVMEVADACGAISVEAAGQVFDKDPPLLSRLRAHHHAIYLGTDGNGPVSPTDESMLEALKDKAYRNTFLGFGRIILWNAGVDRYMLHNLPQEYEQGELWAALNKSHVTVNRLAAMLDDDENRIIDAVVTSSNNTNSTSIQTWGATPEVMLGLVYVDPKYITHHGKSGSRVMTLTIPTPPEQDGREGCPMLQKPDQQTALVAETSPARYPYMAAFHNIATEYYLKGTGYYTKYIAHELKRPKVSHS